MPFAKIRCAVAIITFCTFLTCQSLADIEASSQENITQDKSAESMALEIQILAKMTEEEKEWYEKFQNGTFVVDGWKDTTEEILAVISEKEKKKTENILKILGLKIGAEWSRDNDIRKIDTSKLKDWGKRLRKARKIGEDAVLSTLAEIENEVEKILVSQKELTDDL